jgi:hypothetical protein
MQFILNKFSEKDTAIDDLLIVLMEAFRLFEGFALSALDLRGLQCSTGELNEKAIAFISHLRCSYIIEEGVKQFAFAPGYITLCTHTLIHYGQYIEAWGNVWEWWCFEFERMAGVYTHIVSGALISNTSREFVCMYRWWSWSKPPRGSRYDIASMG